MIETILKKALDGERISGEEALELFSTHDMLLLGNTASRIARRKRNNRVITYIVDRNINYTNVCTFKCRFCGFSKGPLSLNLRGTPYLLTLDDIADRAIEAAEMGATEVCLQGGIHPDFDGDYYIDVARAVNEAVPEMHIHGFTALEVTEGARRNDEPLAEYLKRLMAAGQRSLPGTAAEILDDGIRETLCPDKINTEEWLECHRIAQSSLELANLRGLLFAPLVGVRKVARRLGFDQNGQPILAQLSGLDHDVNRNVDLMRLPD